VDGKTVVSQLGTGGNKFHAFGYRCTPELERQVLPAAVSANRTYDNEWLDRTALSSHPLQYIRFSDIATEKSVFEQSSPYQKLEIVQRSPPVTRTCCTSFAISCLRFPLTTPIFSNTNFWHKLYAPMYIDVRLEGRGFQRVR
jgi:hypothetical protein